MDTKPSFFSVKNSLRGAVLLTGATGYLGSLCLEQLLRCCPKVSTIYVLARGQRDKSAEHRLRRILHSGLFNKVRDNPALLSKVVLLKGDLNIPDVLLPGPADTAKPGGYHPAPASPASTTLSSSQVAPDNGLDVELDTMSISSGASVAAVGSPDAARTLSASGSSFSYWDAEGHHVRLGGLQQLQQEESLLVIHCAARIALTDPLKVTLKANYMGTWNLLRLVKSLPNVKGLVHVSSAYANACKPFLPEGTAHERIYPLCFGDQPVEHVRLVQQVLAMNDDLAEARCKYLCDLWGFPDSYTLGKHLTEQLVSDTHSAQLPVAIVRPSLVVALAGDPYPGYVGNFAGPAGAALAYHLGFFVNNAVTWNPWYHLDGIPGDMASSTILVAGAVLLSDYHHAYTAPPLSITPMGTECTTSPSPTSHCAAGDAEHTAKEVITAAKGPLILHSTSSSVSVLCFYELYVLCKQFYKEYKAHHRRFRLGSNLKFSGYVPAEPTSLRYKLAHKCLKLKVGAVSCLLRCFGHDKAARHLSAGHKAWVHSQDPKHNGRLFFDVSNVLALEKRMSAEELKEFPLIWRGDWTAYFNRYTAAVLALFMHEPVPTYPANDFKLIPDRKVA